MLIYKISSDDAYFTLYKEITSKLSVQAENLNVKLKHTDNCGRYYSIVECSDESHLQKILFYIVDIFKDLLFLEYKHEFFKKNIKINIKDSSLKSLFFSAVTLCDREYDEELLLISRVCESEFAVDSIMRFCITDLIKRWASVCKILTENFSLGYDKKAILDFVKQIVYELPKRVKEITVTANNSGYIITDENLKVLGEFDADYNFGEIASGVLYSCPEKINLYSSDNAEFEDFFKSIFTDRIKVYK